MSSGEPLKSPFFTMSVRSSMFSRRSAIFSNFAPMMRAMECGSSCGGGVQSSAALALRITSAWRADSAPTALTKSSRVSVNGS